MTRVATFSMQRTLAGAMARSQEALVTSQVQLATGKIATDYAGLGSDAVRTLSARSMLSQQQAYVDNSKAVSTKLALYDSQLTNLDDTLTSFRSELMTAIGTGDYPSLQTLLDNTFSDLKNTLNATDGGVPLFAGSQTSTAPFTVESLGDLVGMDLADAFVNDDVKSSARLGDGFDLEYGAGASDVAAKLVEAFKTLAEGGPYDDAKLTDTQIATLTSALGQLDAGMTDLRSVNAANGQNQNRLETMATRAEDKTTLLTEMIGGVEDADLSKVALDLSQRQTILEASYSVFAKVQNLSLVNFI